MGLGIRVQSVTVRREGPKVVLLVQGRRLMDLPWGAALELGQAFIHQARRIEEIEKRDQVVFDQAILNRKGIKIGLAVDPRLREQAMQEAHWNSNLRRYLPGGVASQEAVGIPTIIRHKPRGRKP
ncbi:MAG: hypothetical protein ACRD1K_20665 [Acidimicrobiales bacterium]